MIFVTQRKLSRAITKSKHFIVKKDEWNTKEDTGKSMKMHSTYCGMPKGTYQTKATLNSKKTKPILVAIIKLCLSVR